MSMSSPSTLPARLAFLLPYLHGITRVGRRILPVFISFFFVAVAWFEFGSGYNIPALFWYGTWTFQLLAGFSVTLLLGHVWLATYLVDARNEREFVHRAAEDSHDISRFNVRVMQRVIPSSPYDEEEGYWLGLRWYLSVTWLPLVVLLALAAFVDLFPEPTSGSWGWFALPERWPFLLGMLVALVLIHFVARGLHHGLHRILIAAQEKDRASRLARDEERWLQSLALLVFAILCILFGLCFLIDPFVLPPIFSVCVMFGLLVGVSGAIFFHFRQYALGIFLLIGLLVIVSNALPYKQRFDNLGPEYASPVSLHAIQEPNATIPEDDVEERQRVWQLYAALLEELDPEQAKNVGSLPEQSELSNAQLLANYQTLLTEVRLREEKQLDVWKKRVAGESGKPRLVVVATSGGANRSALWTGVVLDQLENELEAFPQHVRIITGASGGMVGAAHFVTTLNEHGHSKNPGTPNYFQPADLAQDCLTPVVNRMVYRDVPALFLPISPYHGDRGEALELAFERINPKVAMPFSTLDKGEAEGWRPSLIFSPMLVEDGRRLFISNRRLHYLTATEGTFLLQDTPAPVVPTKEKKPSTDDGQGTSDPEQKTPALTPPEGRKRKQLPFDQLDATQRQELAQRYGVAVETLLYVDRYSQSAMQFFRLFPKSRDRFKVSTAMRMNATFPYISPAVELPTDPPRRVVDAAYYDNYGVNTAAQWVYAHREWIVDNTSGVVLIQIRDHQSQNSRRYLYDERQEPGPIGRALSRSVLWLTGPPSAAFSARQSVMSFRNDEQVKLLSDYFGYWTVDPHRPFFATVVFEHPGEISLNWYLTEREKEAILGVFDEEAKRAKQRQSEEGTPNHDALQKLKSWWSEN